jgi:hypothetical protein
MAFEVSLHEALAKQYQAMPLGFGSASTVVSAPVSGLNEHL